MRDQNQDSVEGSWLSMLVDFYVPTDCYNNGHGGLNGSLRQDVSSSILANPLKKSVSWPSVMQRTKIVDISS